MGNFCHGDKNKESQPEDMGNDASIMVEYHAKISSCYPEQDTPNWNYLFHFLIKYFITILHHAINCFKIEEFKHNKLENKIEENYIATKSGLLC